MVEIESEWTGRKRERMGMALRVNLREQPHPSKIGLGGARIIKGRPFRSRLWLLC